MSVQVETWRRRRPWFLRWLSKPIKVAFDADQSEQIHESFAAAGFELVDAAH